MILKKTPKKYTKKLVKRIAWLPTHTEDGYWVWLSKVYCRKYYHGFPFGWVTLGTWLNKENMDDWMIVNLDWDETKGEDNSNPDK